ncbi:MAG: bifunctional folylpolyglutamate synthase/dihydrofolate synthase [Thermomicrobium sp.]|nr:bifunctional folylpolyglutamate synthase/dihydrofolate synthase [Thermomicrobium sp.]
MAEFASIDPRYRWAVSYLRALIQAPPGPPPGTPPEVVRERARQRLERLRSFLAFFGEPHRAYPVVHVTGTSGKGSTSAFIASILHAAGYRVGLHISPYLQVETEKLQIGDRLLPADRFATYVAELDEAVRAWLAEGEDPLTYGEFWTALVFHTFRREAVDFAVVEVGVGGRFDLTNVVFPEVSVITTVGLDHVRTLGPTIRDIAWHKAGIIKPGRPAVTGVDDPDLLAIIADEARRNGAPLRVVLPGRDFTVNCEAGATFLVETRTGRRYRLGLGGRFQAHNAALASAAIRELGWPSERAEAAIAQGLATARFPGRFELVQERPMVVLDGAHNPQKLRALLAALEDLPRAARRIAIFGVLDGHDAEEMARLLAERVDLVFTAAPEATLRTAADPTALAVLFERLGTPAVPMRCVEEAVDVALEVARSDDLVLVTGSLYLVGQARERWYPSAEIVRQRTCWPERTNGTVRQAGTVCGEGSNTV